MKMIKKIFSVILALTLFVGLTIPVGAETDENSLFVDEHVQLDISAMSGNEVVSISAGLFQTAAVMSDGSLWVWGRNSDG